MNVSILQGLGGLGSGLITANQILRQQKQDEINNRIKTAQAGLADVQLKEAQDAQAAKSAYGQIAGQNQDGTQTIARADAPVDEWGNPQVDTIAKPADRVGAFDRMAAEALKRGDQANYAKFTQFSDHLKKSHNEGVIDIAKQIYAGDVDPASAEKTWNSSGTMRVVPGSAKWDPASGTLSGIDASTGQAISMDRAAAQKYLIMAGRIKPDSWVSTGAGTMGNQRTGEVKGEPRAKPLVVNGAIFEQQTDDDGSRQYVKVAEAPRQPSVIIRGGNSDGLTTPQQRANEEIDAARQALSGMSRDEVLRKTQPATATGRNNPDYDPQLAGQWRLANRKKYGPDEQFDKYTAEKSGSITAELQRAKQQTEITRRLSADPAMRGMRAGKMTPQGVEVLDASGRLVGHYN